MKAIFDLLKRIQLDYGVYIGSKSIHKLATFLSGYECALSDICNINPSFNSAFQRFIETKESYKGSEHWSDILMKGSSEDLAFDRFFMLLDEFQNQYEQGLYHMKCLGESQPDVEAIFEFNGTRRTPANDGYRPAHLIKDNYLTTGIHHYYSGESVPPNGTAKGTITFLMPESYPHCLWIGKKISIQEGARIVGYATITNIYNPLLQSENQE